MSRKSIVLFYSWAGHTRSMAEAIARLTGAEMQEIVPEKPYSSDYNTVVNDAKKEIRQGYHPPIRPIERDLSQYDTIFLGTPIWWGTMAPPVATCLEGQDFSGKTILPFTTHGGGGKGHSDRDIAAMCPGAKVTGMYITYEGGGKALEGELRTWLQQNGIR